MSTPMEIVNEILDHFKKEQEKKKINKDKEKNDSKKEDYHK